MRSDESVERIRKAPFSQRLPALHIRGSSNIGGLAEAAGGTVNKIHDFGLTFRTDGSELDVLHVELPALVDDDVNWVRAGQLRQRIERPGDQPDCYPFGLECQNTSSQAREQDQAGARESLTDKIASRIHQYPRRVSRFWPRFLI